MLPCCCCACRRRGGGTCCGVGCGQELRYHTIAVFQLADRVGEWKNGSPQPLATKLALLASRCA